MRVLRVMHRYLGLGLGALWLLQGLSGAILVFGRDVGHALSERTPAAFDAERFGNAIEDFALKHPQRAVTSVLSADPGSFWFDLEYQDPGGPLRYLRIDGQGTAVGTSSRLFRTALDWHQAFLDIPNGQTLVGINGLFLVLTLLLGLKLAWPRLGLWRRALLPHRNHAPTATLYSWHRAAGLWLVAPALATMGAGILLAIGTPVRALAGGNIVDPVAPTAVASDAKRPRLADVIATALRQFPASALAIVTMPANDRPWYRIRLRQPAEIRRFFGTTAVWVDARDGAVLKTHDALLAKPAVALFDGVYPFHTGEIAGFGGRLLTLALGLWLIAMTVMGIALWSRRLRD